MIYHIKEGFYVNNTSIQLMPDQKAEYISILSKLPITEPKSEPEKPSGIPGFSNESLLIGLAISILVVVAVRVTVKGDV